MLARPGITESGIHAVAGAAAACAAAVEGVHQPQQQQAASTHQQVSARWDCCPCHRLAGALLGYIAL